ncbi:hypothetical protein SSCG_05229 [Streptomyces clavuligerus]|nr:hypothetical protein SSCG_05229 [Streptomyces clavuligerus]
MFQGVVLEARWRPTGGRRDGLSPCCPLPPDVSGGALEARLVRTAWQIAVAEGRGRRHASRAPGPGPGLDGRIRNGHDR